MFDLLPKECALTVILNTHIFVAGFGIFCPCLLGFWDYFVQENNDQDH